MNNMHTMFHDEYGKKRRKETLEKLQLLVEQNRCLMVKDYVEFEDILRITDFFISNCGAGSVMVAFATKLQLC